MEKNNKTAEELAREYALTLIDEQFVDGSPALNCAIWGIKKGIELQSSDKDERIKELESALKSAWKCINYLGDVLNSIDATTAEDVEFTDPLVSEVRSALNL